MSMLLNASEITKEELIGFRKPTRKERDRILFPKESKISSVLSFLIVSLGLIIWAGGLIYMYLTISPHAAIMTFLVNIICMTALYIILKIDIFRHEIRFAETSLILIFQIQYVNHGNLTKIWNSGCFIIRSLKNHIAWFQFNAAFFAAFLFIFFIFSLHCQS